MTIRACARISARGGAGRAGRLLFSLLLLLPGCTARYAIYSDPGGADVYVDERRIGRTYAEGSPLFAEVLPGEHLVQVVKPSYLPWSRRVEARGGREVVVVAHLEGETTPPAHAPRGRMEIRTDPGGVDLFLRGDLLGSSYEDREVPVVVRDLVVGKYEIEARKAGYRTHREIVEVYPGATSRLSLRLAPLAGWWEFPTDEDLLRRTALEAARDVVSLTGLSSSRRIAVVRMEGGEISPLDNLIEDALIGRLAQAGFRVAEREGHLLVRLAHESARGESLSLEILTGHGGPDRPFLYDARLAGSASALYLYRPGRGEAVAVRGRVPPPPTRLPTADLILAYHLREANTVPDAAPTAELGEEALRREVRVSLTLRLLDGRSGEVLDQEDLGARYADLVPSRVYPRLAGLGPFAVRPGPGGPPGPGEAASADEPDTVHLAEAIAEGLPDEATARHMTDPDRTFWFFRHLGEAELRGGRRREAAEHLLNATRLRDDYETWLLLAEARMGLGEWDGAREAYLRAVAALSKRFGRF